MLLMDEWIEEWMDTLMNKAKFIRFCHRRNGRFKNSLNKKWLN